MPNAVPANLTSIGAKAKLLQYGPNSLPRSIRKSYFSRFLYIMHEPMLLLLVLIASLYLIMGDLGEGMLLSFSALLVIGISLYQEIKTERALESLRKLLGQRARVIRDNNEQIIPAEELVPGDLIVLHEGDRIPADGTLIESSNLSVDESLLTGESFPVQKTASAGGDVRVSSSTLVVRGKALARVEKTGSETEIGKIGKMLQEEVPTELNLSSEIRFLVKLFGWLGAVACVAIIIFYGVENGDWIKALLLGLAAQLSLLPEEFPVVLTVFMALGAWRLSRVHVLVRQPNSIERLGAITTLCVDKTGTLTQNLMSISCIQDEHTFFYLTKENINALPESHHIIIEYAILASHLDPFDPMEKALRKLAEETAWGKEHLHKDWCFVQDYPLSEKLFAMSCVWKKISEDKFYVIATKGAPEAIANLCHLSEADSARAFQSVKVMASQGLRVLAVAMAQFTPEKLPDQQHDFDFKWLGLVGLEDPLRQEVPMAVRQCHQAGIRVIMMTGDYPETALKIAKEAGIDASGPLITGSQLAQLSDSELMSQITKTHIFARMIPEQKLKVVKALKASKEVVAMTGDGVNDAPGLKWADVGIAMGGRGTDVAREASDIVLLDDNFASIVAGIVRGRTIFSNIKQALSYIASIHVPIAGLALIPVLFDLPLILMPAHIVFLQLIIDPACSLLFESRDAADDVMQRPPRNLKTRLFSGNDLLRSTLQGALLLAASLGTFIAAMKWGRSSVEARAICFSVLVLSNVGLIIADICEGKIRQTLKFFYHRTNLFILLATFFLLMMTLYFPPVQNLFLFAPVRNLDLLLTFLVAFLIFLILSLWNFSVGRKH